MKKMTGVDCEMKVQHIISTMNRVDFAFLQNMALQTDVLVVNQNQPARKEELQLPQGVHVRVISTPEKGLSRSRNCLLENAEGDICIIGDDDVEYVEGYLDIIRAAYASHPDADIIVFRFTHKKGEETRLRYTKDLRMRMQHISRAASVEVTFKREAVLKAGLRFNTYIGLGARFPSGEENAFLADALRAGLKIYHVPVTICVAEEESKISQERPVSVYLTDMGASHHCIYKAWSPLYSLGFVLLRRKKFFPEVSAMKAFGYMLKGKRLYKQYVKENLCASV